MSIINTTIKPFKPTAYQNGKFINVGDADLKGQWSVVLFYPADVTFSCTTEIGDLADKYHTLKSQGVGKKWGGEILVLEFPIFVGMG